MASIANVLVGMKADFTDTESALINLVAKLTQVSDAAHKTGNDAHEAGEKIKEIGHGSEGADKVLDALKESFVDLGAEIIAFGAEALALTSVFEVLKESVEVSAELEATYVALESLTGSAEKATEVIENMEKVANSEALSFSSLLPAAQHMIALGFSVEQTTEAMKAAGNAAWALGTPVESVSRRLAMMAESGRVSNLFLRSLGLNTTELGKVMGVSAGEVTKAFQALSETDRLEILIAALGKFGDVSSKEADTVKGKWIEVKNSWHQAFVLMGEDLEPITKQLENFVIYLGNKTVEMTKTLREFGEGVAISILTGSSAATAAYFRFKHIAEEALEAEKKRKEEAAKSESPKGVNKKHVEEVLSPLRAKEAAPLQLEQIKGAEAANARLAQLNRERVESEIKEEHELRQAKIDEDEDSVRRARKTAEEETRVAMERMLRIGEIDQEEARKKIELIKSREGPERAKTYTPIPNDERALKDAENAEKRKQDIAKVTEDLILKQQKAVDAVTASRGKEDITESKIIRGQTKTERDVVGGKIKTEADVKSIELQTQKIKLEGEYEAELSHTHAQQISHLNEIARLERQSREAKIEGLRGELENIPKDVTDDAATKQRANIQNQITKAKADSAKADAESANKVIKADQDHLKLIREISESKLKSDADVAALQLDERKLKLESEYASQLSHTHSEELAHLVQVAQMELAQRQIKIAALQTELVKVPSGDDPEFLKKRASLAEEISKAQEQSNTATLQSAIKYSQLLEKQNDLLTAQKTLAQALTDWSQIKLGTIAREISESLIAVPQQIGQSLAHSIFAAPQRGQSKGAEIGQGLAKTSANVGEQLAGKLLTNAIEKLIAQFIGQAALDALTATATTANTVALGALNIAVDDLAIAVWTQIGLLGFAGGGDPDPSKPFIAGEKGPEIIHPKGQALTVVPNGPTKTLLQKSDQTFGSFPEGSTEIIPHGKSISMLQAQPPGAITNSSTTNSQANSTIGDMHFYIYGNNNPTEIMRQIANQAKLVFPRRSPKNH